MTRTFKVTPLSRWFSARTIRIRQLARSLAVMDALYTYGPRAPATPYSAVLQQPIRLAESCANLRPSLSEETGASDTAAALIAQGFAAIPLVTMGVTNADVISRNDADDGAADQGMDCT
ncbi:hypothetical protein [Pseudomonas sp. S31]|uniref:hypothetical protein n=1 Tax=Pseudomonas sp. S31 TaxID=1564473 RepID=UPI001F1D71FF|nr:hypothetical protein [Pseudomonas sp. S31]